MNANVVDGTAVTPTSPQEVHRRISFGLRWTVWLSVLTAPLGYLNTVLLARVGPEAIGTFGLLELYTWLTSIFLLFGSGTVLVKFIPELAARERRAFLYSYFVVVWVAMLPYQIAASVWPEILGHVFGTSGGPRLQLTLVWAAPVYVLYALVIAALKSLLEIRFAVLMMRAVPVAACVLYSWLFLAARGFLAAHYTAVIWESYFVLVLLLTIAGARRLALLMPASRRTRALPFFLPKGFWGFSLGLQASSILGFLSTRLDYLFVLNAGGLEVFGKYVALMALVALVQKPAMFILDSFLPCLTNALSLRDSSSPAAVTRVWLRMVLLSTFTAATFAIFFTRFLVDMLGKGYADLVQLVPIAALVASIEVINIVIGTVFFATLRPFREATAKGVRTVLFCCLFWPLWGKAHLLGAVIAWTICEVVQCCVASFLLLRRDIPFEVPLLSTAVPYVIAITLIACLPQIAAVHSVGSVAALWLASIVGFLALSRYSLSELNSLIRMLLPGRFNMSAS